MEFFKTSLGKTVAGLVAVFLIILSVKAAVETMGIYNDTHEAYKNTIVVTGEGKIQSQPDIAQMDLSVVSRGTSVAALKTDNTNKMNAVITAMKTLGIEDKDIRSTTFALNPEYSFDPDGNTTPRILGYSLEQGIEVKVRMLEKAGDALQKAVDAGANQVGAVVFTIDDPAGLKVQAREKAFTQAKDKASTLARQAGVTLGKVVNFSDDSTNPMPMNNYYSDSSYMEAKVGAAPSMPVPNLQPGSQDVIANVSVTYEIY